MFQINPNITEPKALFNIGYGLYVITCTDGVRDNGMICNTVMQITDSPKKVAVCINKNNFSHDMIVGSGIMNVNCISDDASFALFRKFGYTSGKNGNKFENEKNIRSDNGVIVLTEHINAYISLKVEQSTDVGTHTLFICSVTQAQVISDKETVTYTGYQKNIKPQTKPAEKTVWVCSICGHVFEGETLPDDYICPVCSHSVDYFEKSGR